MGIGEKILVGKLVKFQLENWPKPYVILYHKYPLSRLTKLSAVNTSGRVAFRIRISIPKKSSRILSKTFPEFPPKCSSLPKLFRGYTSKTFL